MATLALTAALPRGAAAQPATPSVADAVTSIDAEIVRNHVGVLASDQLRGRDTPSEGLESAARYIADLHASFGLRPAGDDGTFLQRYPFGLQGPDPRNAEINFVGPEGEAPVEIGRDAFIDGGSTEPFTAPLVYVPAEAVAGAIESGSMAGEAAVFELSGSWGQELWQRSLEQLAFARAAGAVAVVHLLDSGFPSSVISQVGSALAQPTWRLGGDALLPRIFVRRGVIDRVLPEASRTWAESATRGQITSPRAIPGARIGATMPLNALGVSTPPNVVAELPGSDGDLRDEYVVLTAHFDHVGVGRPVDGDSIYNGADDNGSGTAALLEVSRALAALPPEARPRRTILFAHVSGEEKGLLGSEWWVDHPTRPIENVVANINIDMVGGDAHPDTLAVLGNEYSSLGPLIMGISRARPELGLTTVSDMWPQEGLFFRSDQFNFMREDIPSLFLFAGLHECYHRPCDDIDFVNTDKIARVARLLTYTVLEIANAEVRPQWNPDGLSEVRRMTSGRR